MCFAVVNIALCIFIFFVNFYLVTQVNFCDSQSFRSFVWRCEHNVTSLFCPNPLAAAWDAQWTMAANPVDMIHHAGIQVTCG